MSSFLKNIFLRQRDINELDYIGRNKLMLNINDTKYSKKLIKRGIDIHHRDDNGRTPLVYSLSCKTIDIFVFLIEKGSDVNTIDDCGRTLLMHSVYYNNSEITGKILNNMNVNILDFFNISALMLASYYNNNVAVKELIKYKANLNTIDIDGNNALKHAISNDNIDVVKELIENKIEWMNDDEILLYTYYGNHLEIFKYLIFVGANIRNIYFDDNEIKMDTLKYIIYNSVYTPLTLRNRSGRISKMLKSLKYFRFMVVDNVLQTYNNYEKNIVGIIFEYIYI